MGSMRGCSSQNSPEEMQEWEPGSATRLGIRSPLCSRVLRSGDARMARVSSSAAARIRRKAQPSASRSSPAGSRKVNSNSVFTGGRAATRPEYYSSEPSRIRRVVTIYGDGLLIRFGLGRIAGAEERIDFPTQVPAGGDERGSSGLNG